MTCLHRSGSDRMRTRRRPAAPTARRPRPARRRRPGGRAREPAPAAGPPGAGQVARRSPAGRARRQPRRPSAGGPAGCPGRGGLCATARARAAGHGDGDDRHLVVNRPLHRLAAPGDGVGREPAAGGVVAAGRPQQALVAGADQVVDLEAAADVAGDREQDEGRVVDGQLVAGGTPRGGRRARVPQDRAQLGLAPRAPGRGRGGGPPGCRRGGGDHVSASIRPSSRSRPSRSSLPRHSFLSVLFSTCSRASSAVTPNAVISRTTSMSMVERVTSPRT